jgi:hypothetical protein
MKICLSLVHLTTAALLLLHIASAQADLPQARIVSLNVDPEQVVVLHLRPGYVSSVRVLEEVSSVVLGDPGAFKADHSEAEPQLVFFKATSAKPAQTNALITTRGGHEISLSLVSQGKSDRSEPVDYVLNCERPRSFLIASTHPMFVVGETKNVATENRPSSAAPEKPGRQEQDLVRAERIEKEQQMAVQFAVLNSSARTIEVLPPQIQLAGISKDKHRKAIKAEPVPIKDYWITSSRLAPGTRADGIVVFERPTFKESRERLLLAVAQAEEVDRPVLAPIAFVAPVSGGAK